MRQVSRGLIGYVIMIAAFIFLIVVLSGGTNTVDKRIEYPELLQMIEKGEIDRVSIRGYNLVGHTVTAQPRLCRERMIFFFAP